jgi:hypothetical protein
VSKGYISAELRRLVASRADFLCEYCLLHEDDLFFRCEVDHIISERHGGSTSEDNLAYACFFCNRNKGSDIASVEPKTGELVRLFNPRLDSWPEHFELEEGGALIVPRSAIGEATIRLLGLNLRDRLLERETLQEVGRYPSVQALRRMRLTARD